MGKLTKAFEKSFPRKNQVESPGGRHLSVLDKISDQAFAKVDPAHMAHSRASWDERLQISTAPESQIFESFRRLRARLLYSEHQPRTILVTSVMPGEGKGFVCASLGVALSQDMEHQALMLDCDFRRPSLAWLFGISNEIGLVDYLQEDVDLSLLVRKTAQPKLSLVPCGKPPKNPSELLSSGKMIGLISELSEHYPDRMVLFDSPPNIVASETSVLANYVDGLILVIRHGIAKKEQVKKFVEAVGPEKIVGLVYNACPEDKFTEFINKKMYYGYSRYKYY